MKNENIKLHSNITKIFKYLVFIVALFTLFLFVQSNRCLAFDYLSYDSSKISSSASDYRVDVAYRAPNWWVTSKIEITFCEIGNSSSCTTFTKENPPDVKVETIYRFYNNGEYDYLKNVSWGKAEYSSKQKNSTIKGFSSFKQGLEVSVKAEVYVPGKRENRYFSKKIYDWGVPHSFEYSGNLTDSTICVYNNSSYCTETAIKQTDWAQSHELNITYSETTKAEYCIGSMHPNAGYDCGGNRNGWKEFTSNEQITVETTDYVYLKFDSKTFYVEKDEKAILFRVDKIAPSVTVPTPDDASTWAKSHTVSGITFKDRQSGVNDSTKYYCWSTSSTTPDSTSSCWTSFTDDSVTKSSQTGEYYLHIKVSDNAGNVGYGSTSNSIKFDNTSPTITANEPNNTSAWSKLHTVSGITFSDSHSGVNDSTKYYCWSTSSTTPSSSCWKSFTGSSITNSSLTGEFYLHLQASDNVGNVETKTITKYTVKCFDKNCTIKIPYIEKVKFKFDNTAPAITIGTITNDGNWAKNHTVTVTVKDPHSGNKTLHYCWSVNSISCSGTSSSIDISGNSDTKTISGDSSMSGTYYLLVWAEDQLGNTSSQVSSSAIYFDNGNPKIPLPAINEYKKRHTVNFTIEDTYSGVSIIKYCLSQSETKAYSSSDTCWETYTVTSGRKSVSVHLAFDGVKEKYNGIYYLHVYAGDSVVESTKNTNQSKTQLKFDNTKPVISSLKVDSTEWKQKHSVTFSVKDEHSGISLLKYCLSSSTTAPDKDNECWKTYDISKEENKNEITGTISLTDKVNGIYYLHLYIEDSVVEVVKNSIQGTTLLKYDNENPVIDNIVIDSRGWKKTHVVKMNIKDNYSGIDEIRYTWCRYSEYSRCGNTSSWSTLSVKGNVTYSFESYSILAGEYYLHVYVADKTKDTRNYAYKSVEEAIKVDTTAPEITSIQVDTLEWKKVHVVTANISDYESKVKEVRYIWCSNAEYSNCGNISTWLVSGKTGNGTYSFINTTLTGNYYLHIRAINSNEDVQLKTYGRTESALKFDNTAPSLTLNIDSTGYAKTHKITITALDAHSGLETTKYYCNGCSDTDLLNRKNIYSTTGTAIIHSGDTGSYNIKVLVYDKVGNYTIKTSAIYYLDNTAPVIDSINSGEMITTNNNKLIIKAHDAHVGVIKTLQVNYDGETYSLTKGTDGNYTHIISKELRNEKLQVTITLVDSLGNSDSKEYTLNIDTVTIKAFDKNGEALERIELPKLSLSKPKIESVFLQEEVEENMEISEVVVLSEEIEVIEVNEIEEVEEIETKVVELPSSEVSCNSVNFSYVNEELKKLFVIEKKNNKWISSKQ